MTENKRYFKREWEEEYYIFDSTEISEEKVDEEIEFGYEIFAESMQGDKVVNKLNEQEETIQSLKKELFESEKDYLIETYSDNPIRRDEKIHSLKEEFKERFGDV